MKVSEFLDTIHSQAEFESDATRVASASLCLSAMTTILDDQLYSHSGGSSGRVVLTTDKTKIWSWFVSIMSVGKPRIRYCP